MIMQYRQNASDVFWSYRWSLGSKPKVHFANPKAKTDAIYCLEQLQSILRCSDEENSFIPVPRHIMESALSVVNGQMSDAA